MRHLLIYPPLSLALCLCMGSDRLESARVAPPTQHTLVVIKDSGDELPSAEQMEALAKDKPLVFLEKCLLRYNREVKGYTATFVKQEFINRQLRKTEVTNIAFREKPFSVFMAWTKEGLVGRAERVLFVEGENDGQMLCRPAGKVAQALAGKVVSREVDGRDARDAGRYTMQQFGFKRTTERTLSDWKTAMDDDTLKIDYLGVKKLKEADDRPCWTLRSQTKKPNKDGIAEALIYIDKETWLQYGTVLKDSSGNLLGSYYFRDVKLNPEFAKDQFTKEAIAKD